jgi:hypothetical protein
MPVARRTVRSTVGPLAVYGLLSLAFFGRPLANGGQELVGIGNDPRFYVWAIGWWPHALLNGENPIVTYAMWPLTGFNLAWSVTVPALALPVAPVTLLAGPAVAYNVVAVAMPALAAWTAFLLCRYLTGSWWASLAGGYLFGFSGYMLGHTTAHPGMTSVFLIPLIALTVLQFVDEKIGRRGLAVRLGLLLGVQPYLSTEVFATLTVVLVASLLAAFVLVRDVRPRLRRAVLPVVAAYGIACVVASPILWYALTDFHSSSINDPARFPSDLLNLVVPTETMLLNTGGARELSRDFTANLAENGAYLGLPLLVVLGWFAWQRWREPGGRLLLALLALGVLAELGVALHVAGDRVVALPWALAEKLPVLNNVLPARFSMYVALGAGVAVALWAASPRPSPWLRAALVAAAAISFVPDTSASFWRTTPDRPAFFADDIYRSCFRPDETVFMPDIVDTEASLWQAESGYRFRLANGHLGDVFPEGIPDPDVAFAVLYGSIPEGGGAAIVRLARGLGSTVILLDAEQVDEWGPVLEDAGLEAVENGGVWLYHLGPVPPGCRA